MNTNPHIFLGIKGSVVCVDKYTGSIVWKTRLRLGNITLIREDGQIFACCNGNLYALDAATGEIMWHNPLTGLGFGHAVFAGGNQQPPPASKTYNM